MTIFNSYVSLPEGISYGIYDGYNYVIMVFFHGISYGINGIYGSQ